jgi:riboflavin synthase
MFTGITVAIGKVTDIVPAGDGLHISVDLGELDVSLIRPGDSIAVSGVCLTVTGLQDTLATFDVSRETIDKTLMNHWRAGHRANLEPALTLDRPLGGHLVSGHVDGSASLEAVEAGSDSTWMRFRVPRALGRFIAIKGSLALDGVSLTSNHVEDDGDDTLFDLTLVPHTLAQTTLGGLRPGYRVHIEVDMMARYLDRMMQSDRSADAAAGQ